MASLAFLLGVTAGGGAVLWWQARPAPTLFRADEHAVELVLFDARPPGTGPRGRESAIGPLHVDSALLLSGTVTATVLEIDTPARGLDVRAPALPVRVSTTGRFQAVDLEVIVRDCAAATRWTPGDRPFTVTWRDEFGRMHLDRAGDFGRSTARALTRYVDAACDKPPKG